MALNGGFCGILECIWIFVLIILFLYKEDYENTHISAVKEAPTFNKVFLSYKYFNNLR